MLTGNYYCVIPPTAPLYKEIKALHDAAVANGHKTYNEGHWRVATVAALLTIGNCCNRNCRHCPFTEENKR